MTQVKETSGGQEPQSDVKGVLSWLTITFIPVLFLLVGGWLAVRFLLPAVDYHEPSEVRTLRLEAITPGVHVQWLREGEFFLVREGNFIYVLSAKEKYADKYFHQKVLLNWNAERNLFVEQTWGSLYDKKGNPAGGPTLWTLDRLALRLNDAGEVMVDPKNIQDLDGEIRKTAKGSAVDEALREKEPFVLRVP